MQGLENVTGSSAITVTAPGFTAASQTVNVATTGIEVQALPTSTTTLSTDDTFYVQVGIPNANNTAIGTVQNLRAGGPAFVFTLSNDAPLVAQLKSDEPPVTGQTVTKPILPGIYYPQSVTGGISPYGLAFDPIGNGTTHVTVTGPPGVVRMTTNGIRTVTVTSPGISLTSAVTVGAGLQLSASASLGASQHGGVDATVSSSAGLVLVSPNATTAGSAAISVHLNNGQTSIPFYVQGLENSGGTAVISVAAPGFTTATMTVTVTAAGVELQALPTSTTSASADDTFYVQVGLPNVNNTALSSVQNVRAGGPQFVVTLANSNATVARLKSDEPALIGQAVSKPILPGFYYPQSVTAGIPPYGLAFDPLAVGSTTLTVTGPTGVLTMSTNGNRTVSVTTPGITINSTGAIVGAGLQKGSSTATLAGPAHGGVTLRIASSDPTIALVSPNPSTAGAAFIDLPIADGVSTASYYLQGTSVTSTGSVTITASVSGFTGASGSASVVQPALQIENLATSIGATAATTSSSSVSGFRNAGNADAGDAAGHPRLAAAASS